MNFTPLPPLEHLALVKIAVTMWHESHIQGVVSLPYCSYSGGKVNYQTIENKIIEKASNHLLPERCKRKLLSFIKLLGLQILQWMSMHNYHYRFKEQIKLCWTTTGTLDVKKTIRKFVQDETINPVKRFELACEYCLENDIHTLWEQLSKNKYNVVEYFEVFDEACLPLIWVRYLGGKPIILPLHDRRYTFYQDAFYDSVVLGNEVAVQYFLQKVISEEKEQFTSEENGQILISRAEMIIKIFSDRQYLLPDYNRYNSLLCFLLSAMNEEQQKVMFESYAFHIVVSLLSWPWHLMIPEIPELLWNFLNLEDYYKLLNGVYLKYRMLHWEDCDYQDLYGLIWRKIPKAYKVLFLSNRDTYFLPFLIHTKDEKNIRLVLKDAILLSEKLLIFQEKGKAICVALVRSNLLDTLKFFIRECVSSKDSMLKIKEHIDFFLPKQISEQIRDVWKPLYILDKCIICGEQNCM